MARHPKHVIPDTTRIELFSDAVFAIIITLLVLELHVPEIEGSELMDYWHAFEPIFPKLGSFAFSFLTVAIFWVNHHHFFHEVGKSDWILLWTNNLLLFWLCLIPFTTAVLGDYPMQGPAIAFYCLIMFLAASSFMMMVHYAFFVGDLAHENISMKFRRAHFRRGLVGVVLYGSATLLALWYPLLGVIAMVGLPLFYFIPSVLDEGMM